MESSTLIRVRYAETDAMGIVHHDGPPSANERSECAGALRGAQCDRGVVLVAWR
jgi:hypothetical protein